MENNAMRKISESGEIPSEVKDWLVNTFCQKEARKKMGNFLYLVLAVQVYLDSNI
jgi:F0F1-type ATP synthase delta subunit